MQKLNLPLLGLLTLSGACGEAPVDPFIAENDGSETSGSDAPALPDYSGDESADESGDDSGDEGETPDPVPEREDTAAWIEDGIVFALTPADDAVVDLDPQIDHLFVAMRPDGGVVVRGLDASLETRAMWGMERTEGSHEVRVAMPSMVPLPCFEQPCIDPFPAPAVGDSFVATHTGSTVVLDGVIDGVSYGFSALVDDGEVVEASSKGELSPAQVARLQLAGAVLDQTGAVLAELALPGLLPEPVCVGCEVGRYMVFGGRAVLGAACCAGSFGVGCAVCIGGAGIAIGWAGQQDCGC